MNKTKDISNSCNGENDEKLSVMPSWLHGSLFENSMSISWK